MTCDCNNWTVILGCKNLTVEARLKNWTVETVFDLSHQILKDDSAFCLLHKEMPQSLVLCFP